MRRVDKLTMRIAAFLFALFAPAIAVAQPLAPSQFEDLTMGKSYYFASPDGQFYGAEQYLPNRRVLWMYADGTCTEGRWFPVGQTLCFLYVHQDSPHCWISELRDGRLFAYTEGSPPQDAIGSTSVSPDPLPCAGPDVGV